MGGRGLLGLDGLQAATPPNPNPWPQVLAGHASAQAGPPTPARQSPPPFQLQTSTYSFLFESRLRERWEHGLCRRLVCGVDQMLEARHVAHPAWRDLCSRLGTDEAKLIYPGTNLDLPTLASVVQFMLENPRSRCPPTWGVFSSLPTTGPKRQRCVPGPPCHPLTRACPPPICSFKNGFLIVIGAIPWSRSIWAPRMKWEDGRHARK